MAKKKKRGLYSSKADKKSGDITDIDDKRSGGDSGGQEGEVQFATCSLPTMTNSIVPSVAHIRKGRNFATELASARNTTISFQQSGILNVVLQFLQKCENETFDEVMSDVSGSLKSPTTWIKVLWNAVSLQPECRLQIANSIGPLVRCMCNDTARTFFNSNQHWRDGIVPFVEMIYNTLPIDGDISITTFVLQDGELIRSIVQWGFWGKETRPDIENEIGHDNCKRISGLGGLITRNTIVKITAAQTEIGKNILSTIGTTSIVNKQYDPSCKVSFVAGLMLVLTRDAGNKEAFSCLDHLITKEGCVDRGVIVGLIGLGQLSAFNDDSLSEAIARISYHVLLIKGHPSDTRVACAVRAGIIDMCLGFIQHHHRSGDDKNLLFEYIGNIFKAIQLVSLHMKTSKVIKSKRNILGEKLLRVEEGTSTPCCKELLSRVKCILELNSSYCCRCNKSLSRTEVKLCNGCGRMTYCSRACQKEDWWNGHEQACCKSYTDQIAGQFQGRFFPEEALSDERDAAKLKELEINVNMIQLKLFLDNSDTILDKAKSLVGIPLYDCVVLFDLRVCPVKIDVEKYAKEFDTPAFKKDFEDCRSIENITCVYSADFYNGRLAESDETTLLCIQRLFPHEWLMDDSVMMTKHKQVTIEQELRDTETIRQFKREDKELAKMIKDRVIQEMMKAQVESGSLSQDDMDEFVKVHGNDYIDVNDFLSQFSKWKNDKKIQELEKVRKSAEILGVDPNADERTITVAFRELALKYHPDKVADNSPLNKEEIEKNFKMIEEAADHLLSKFDDDGDGIGEEVGCVTS